MATCGAKVEVEKAGGVICSPENATWLIYTRPQTGQVTLGQPLPECIPFDKKYFI